VRIIFDDVSELNRWIEKFVREDRHVIYVTKNKEIVIVPKVSTKPVILVYAKLGSEGVTDVMKVIPDSVERFIIKSFDWKDDSPVGARMDFLE